MQEPLLKNPDSNRRMQMQLTINIAHENNFDLKAIAEEISFHSRVLQELTITLNIVENSPRPSYNDVQKFAEAIRKCTKLRSCKIEDFFATFHKTHWQSIFYAITAASGLETISFRNTYLGPIGYRFARETLCSLDKLTSVDLTQTAMVTYDDVEDLASLLALNTSLSKVILGKSPMTLEWWQMLNSALDRKTPPTLVWEPSTQNEMQDQMRKICSALLKQGYSSGMDDASYILSLFIKQTEKFDQEWSAFKAKYDQAATSKLLSPMAFLAKPANTNISQRTPGNYGTNQPGPNPPRY